MNDKPKNLRVVDQDTGTEIAELGVVRKKAVACVDCRFYGQRHTWVQHSSGSTYVADECLAFQQPCTIKNPNADCEYFEPRAVLERRTQRSLAVSYATSVPIIIIVTALAFLFGRCVG